MSCLTEEHPLQTRNQRAPQRTWQKVFLQIGTSMLLKPPFLFSLLSEYLFLRGARAHTHIHQTKIKTKTKQETQTTYRKARGNVTLCCHLPRVLFLLPLLLHTLDQHFRLDKILLILLISRASEIMEPSNFKHFPSSVSEPPNSQLGEQYSTSK